jgi:hypothetical protein
MHESFLYPALIAGIIVGAVLCTAILVDAWVRRVALLTALAIIFSRGSVSEIVTCLYRVGDAAFHQLAFSAGVATGIMLGIMLFLFWKRHSPSTR